MNTVTYDDLFDALDILKEQIADDRIAVVDKTEKRIVALGLQIVGTTVMSADDALKFADNVKKASDLVTGFKYNGYKIVND